MTERKSSIEKLIKSQKFYYANPDITDRNFPAPKTVQTENWKLIRMEKAFASQEALDEMRKQGCQPANAHELALWKVTNGGELKDREWCLAFGKTWQDSDGDRGVPSVGRSSGGGWSFGLDDFGGDWDSDRCLLGFCDPSLETSILGDSLPSDTLIAAIGIVKNAGYKIYKEI